MMTTEKIRKYLFPQRPKPKTHLSFLQPFLHSNTPKEHHQTHLPTTQTTRLDVSPEARFLDALLQILDADAWFPELFKPKEKSSKQFLTRNALDSKAKNLNY